MRITEDRYSQHRRSLDLAWRLIRHEARTRTISRWTQLTGHRIRQLYKSYSSKQHKQVTRHRGMSPYKLEMVLSSPRLRCEGAMFAAICQSLRVLPQGRLSDPERALPSIERGELLCEAYEWFSFDVPDTRLTFEYGLLLINELARGELVRLGACRTCRGVILLDRLSTGRLQCVFCSTRIDTQTSVLRAKAEFLRNPGEPLVDGSERDLCERRGCEQVRVDPAEAPPSQLSCLDEAQNLSVVNDGDVRQLGQRAHKYRESCQVTAGQLPDHKRMGPNLNLFEQLDERCIPTSS